MVLDVSHGLGYDRKKDRAACAAVTFDLHREENPMEKTIARQLLAFLDQRLMEEYEYEKQSYPGFSCI